MSYGVVASKPAEVRLERLTPSAPPAADTPNSSPWASGRLTLTSLHLSFVPTRASHGVPALSIALADILAVETAPGRLRRTLTFRTADFALRVRVTGSAAFGRRVTTSVEACRRRAAAGGASDRPDAERPLRSEL